MLKKEGRCLPTPATRGARVGEAKNPGPNCGELTKRSSKHRPRGQKPKQVDLVLFNTSGERQLCDALDHYRSTREAPGQVQVAALVAQEHHLRGDSWADMQHKARRAGWTAHGAPAVLCAQKSSAGVCIAVRSKFGSGKPSSLPVDASPGGSLGRLACTWIDGVVRGGLLVISMYLWHSEGLSRRNMELLCAAGDVIIKHGGPWLIGADFNMPPEELSQASRWLAKIGGVIKAPNVPTCRSLNGGRVIDFVVVDKRIAGAVTLWTDLAFPGSPHSPVVVRLNTLETRKMALFLMRPASLPPDQPQGCSFAAPIGADAKVLSDAKKCLEAQQGHVVPAPIDAAFSEVIMSVETEWCEICGQVDSTGQPLRTAGGRARGPLFKRIAVVPRMPLHGVSRTDAIGLGLCLISNSWSEMAGIIRRCSSSQMIPQAAAVRWNAITQLLGEQCGLVGKAIASDPGKWRWKCYASSCLTAFDADAADVLRKWATEAKSDLELRSKDLRRKATSEWRSWVDEQLHAGSGALHRFTKREELMPDVAAQMSGGLSFGLDDLLKAARDEWAAVWERFSSIAKAPWRSCPQHIMDRSAPLPPLTTEMLREAAKTFKSRTGLGCDSAHPRKFGWLSEEVLLGLASLLTMIEDSGIWPEQVSVILIALIPKPGGGKRPIGILPGLVRLWERVRRPIVQKWRAKVERSYNWAAKGRSPQAAVWLQALKAEAAAARGLCSAAGMLDLVKAFEMVRLEMVWYRGLELGFPAAILRATLESFSFVRRLMLDGAVSTPVATVSAILAGGGFATDAMFIVLVKPCDTLARELPSSILCLFVDDLTIHVVGNANAVKAQLAEAIELSINMLEDDMGLMVSRAKTFVTASSWTLAKLLRPRLRKLGIGVQSKAKMLGIDFSCGKKIARASQAARVRKVLAKKSRYCKLGKKAAGRLVKAGAAPAMQYGASVYGTPSRTLKAIRGFACSVRGEMRGRSTFARLELARYDPGADCATAPITDWAKAIWDKAVCCEDLQVVWQKAHSLIAGNASPFRHVAGPGGAMLASCLRLGWKVPRYDVVMKRDGTMLDLTIICPMQIKLHALQDLRRSEASSSSLAIRLGGPPDLEPLSDYLATRIMARKPAAASLRALGEGGWWSQSRLFKEGRATDPWCKACGDRGGLGHVEGTLHHRMCSCDATQQARHSFKCQEVIRKAQSAVHGSEPLFQHGVPILLEAPLIPQKERRSCGGVQQPPDFTATGNAFTDGAMRGRAPKYARRAGWSWVVVDDEGQVIFGLYGPCPDPFPTAFRAELRAVCELLMMAVPPLTVWIDNSEVLDGWSRGRHWCCSSSRSAADLWTIFWNKIQDIGDEGILLKKTKGHATEVDVQLGRCSAFARAGNDHADHFAGRGVDAAISQSPNQRDIDAYREAITWYQWLTQLCGVWPADTDPRPKERQRRGAAAAEGIAEERRRKAEEQLVNTVNKQENIVYELANKDSSASGELPALQELIQRKALHVSHCLRLTGSLVWCDRCGSYAKERFKSLKVQCSGPQHAKSKAGQLAQLRRGRHPLTGEVIGKPVALSEAAPTARGTSTARGSSSLARSTSTISIARSVRSSAAAQTGAARAMVTTSAPTRSSSAPTRSSSAPTGEVKALVVALSRPTYRLVGHALGKLV